jgi:transcriptional regulator with XRE-family HTH domain
MEEEALAGRFGALVRRLRFERAYSQENLAEAAGLERAYVGMIERGEVNVSVRTAFRLARALDLTLSLLFSELEQDHGWGRDAAQGSGDDPGT